VLKIQLKLKLFLFVYYPKNYFAQKLILN